MKPNAAILITDLTKDFNTQAGKITALNKINLTIQSGEFFCIVGPSGCGKTTLLRILAGLDTASSGTTTIANSDGSRPTNSLVFQEQSVFPWMNILGKQFNHVN